MFDEQESSAVQIATRAFGTVNVLIGVLGFFGPAVTGNEDRFVNTRPGHLLGVAAINWLHALLHALYGMLCFKVGKQPCSSRVFMGLSAMFWGAMAAMGWRATGVDREIHLVKGLALDVGANVVHTIWAVIGFVGVWPSLFCSEQTR